MENKNFGLTELAFQDLVSGMQNGNEELFEHIFLSQFENSTKYLRQRYKMTYEQAYDACMDSLLEFRRGLMQNKIVYGNLNFLFTKMASQRFFKNAKKDNMFDEIPENFELPIARMELNDTEKIILDKSWAKLGHTCQSLLKSFYYDNVKLKVLAEQDGRKPESIRKQKQRCLNTLRINFQSFIKS